MSVTVTETETRPKIASFKFTEPDLSIGPEERGLYAPAAPKDTQWVELPLHDYRNSDLTKGPAGIDKHGFTVVKHQPPFNGDEWYTSPNLEEVYFSEIQKLVKSVTGAKDVSIQSCAFRRKLATRQDDDKFSLKRDQGIDVSKIPLDRPTSKLHTVDSSQTQDSLPSVVTGRQVEASREPARPIHIDYTLKGLQSVIRSERPDIQELARDIIKAEDLASKQGTPYKGPRYAGFSIWRPVRQVPRDPLAVADFRTLDHDDLVAFEYRAPTLGGEFYNQGYMLKAPKEGPKTGQKWYYLPDQRPDEVLVIKLADSETLYGKGDVAGGTAHGSPIVYGTEEKEPRESVEVRVVAFW